MDLYRNDPHQADEKNTSLTLKEKHPGGIKELHIF